MLGEKIVRLHMTTLTGNASLLTNVQTVSGKKAISSPPVARYVQGAVWHFEEPRRFASTATVNPIYQINGCDIYQLQTNPSNFSDVARRSSLHIGGAHVAMAYGSVRSSVEMIDYSRTRR